MAPLLRSGNPLRSEQNFDQEPHHSETEAKDHSPKLSTQSLATSEVNRKAKVSNVEAKNSFLWTLILSLSWLTEGSLQAAYRISLAYSGPAAAFSVNYGGDVFVGSSNTYFVYNNYDPPVLLGTCKLRIYSTSANEAATIDSDNSFAEGATLPQSDKVLVLGQTSGMSVFNIAENSGSISLSLNVPLSSTSLNHNAYFSSGISDNSTGFTYATYYALLTDIARFYKIHISSPSSYSTYTLNAAYGMNKVLKLAHGPADTLLAVGTSNLLFLAKSNLQFVKTFNNPDLGYFALSEPTNQTVCYVGSDRGSNDYLTKVDSSALVWEALLPNMALASYAVNVVRVPTYRFGVLNEALQSTFRVFDIDTMSIVLTESVSGSLSRVSLRFGQIIGKSFYLGIVNSFTTRFQIYNLTVDFCAVAWQNPCLSCELGSYLFGSGADNLCLRPKEIPAGYGVSGQSVASCATGCLVCTLNASQCTICDTAGGYYLFSPTSTCLQEASIPNTYGLDRTTSPFSIVSCSDSHCLECRSDRSLCAVCSPSFFLLDPSDGSCRPNNTLGLGSVVVGGVGRLTLCTTVDCGDCRADHSVCVSCRTDRYRRAGGGADCYANTEAGYGLDGSVSPAVLRVCGDAHCLDCLQDYQICAACTSPYYRLSSTCVLGSPGMGPDNTNTLQPCAILHCSNCGNHYSGCLECASPYYLLSPNLDSCSLNQLPGKGIDWGRLPPMIRDCEIPNCLECYSDSAHCEVCAQGYYSSDNTGADCTQNLIPRKGLDRLGNKIILGPCEDSNCERCFSNNSICEECQPGYYLKDNLNIGSSVCVQNNINGYGITNGAGKTISPCETQNCATCYTNHSVCTSCKDHTFRTDFADGCFYNTGVGYGPKWTGSDYILSKCSMTDCAVCRVDFGSCTGCKLPKLLDLTTKTCVENNVQGMGRWLDISGYGILSNCTDLKCLDCFSDNKKCEKCRSSDNLVDPVERICITKAQQTEWYQLNAIQPTYFNSKLKSFRVQFSEPLIDTGVDLNSQLSFMLMSVSGKKYESSDYSVKASITSTGELLGQFSATGMVEESTLTISHSNSSKVLFRSESSMFYPYTQIQIQQLQYAPPQELEGLVGTATKQAIMGVSIVSLLTISTSGGGGGKLATLFSVIEYIEYVLYVDGVRVIRGDQFLYFFSFDPLQLIPNFLVSDGDLDRCDPGPNFARGQMKCDILRNCGVHIQWVCIATVGCLLFFWAAPKCIEKVKSPKVKSILEIANYLPSHFFSPSLILTFVEGPHIDIIRSALLNLLIYPLHRSSTNLLGLIVSVGLVGLYAAYASKLIAIGLQIRSQPAGEQQLPKHQFFRETFERIRLTEPGNTSDRWDSWRFLLPGIVIIKNAVIQAMIVFLAGHGLIQIWMVILVQIANIGLWTVIKPYKRWTDNLHMMIVAVAKLCISVCLVIVNMKQDEIGFEDRETYFGSVLISLYSACILSILFSILAESFIHLWTWITSNKSKVSNKQIASNKVRIKPGIRGGTFAKLDMKSSHMAKPTLELKSLKQIAPITSMKRGSIQSQKMIHILKPGAQQNSNSCRAIILPQKVGVKKQLHHRHTVNKQPPEKLAPVSSSRLQFNKSAQREETEEAPNTNRNIRDPKLSSASISRKNWPGFEMPGGSLQDLQDLNRSVGGVQPRPSFRNLPPINVKRRVVQHRHHPQQKTTLL